MSSSTIAQFDPSTIKPGSVISIVGPTATGKTALAANIVRKMETVNCGCVFTTPSQIPYYEDALPHFQRFCTTELTEKIKEILQIQKRGSKEERAAHFDGRYSETVVEHIGIIIDDLFEDATSTKCMRELFMNGRHLGITLVFTSQTDSIGRTDASFLSSQTDIHFISGHSLDDNSRDKQLDAHMKEIGCTYSDLTNYISLNNYNFLVLDQRSDSSDLYQFKVDLGDGHLVDTLSYKVRLANFFTQGMRQNTTA